MARTVLDVGAVTMTLQEGAMIGGYRLLRQLGAGGMGEVWLGEHAMLGRRAAIKMLHDTFSSRPEIVTRFFNEARAATSISDPGIVQVFDFGHHTDGTGYIVMEMLDGESLEERLRRHGSLELGEVLRLMRQVASSLGAAHARGIVHRDLKPDNIFIVRDPEVNGGERTKLLDFGIAKLAADDAGLKTQTSALMGTPMFMSPEQCRGAGQVDQRSDIYSLGCVMFLLLAGRPPFEADGAGDLIIKHVIEAPPSLAACVPGLPVEVDALVGRCLAKQAAHRPASGIVLAAELGALIERVPMMPQHARSIETPMSGISISVASTTLSSATSAISQPVPRRRSRAIIAASFVAALAGGAVIAGVASQRPGTDSSSSVPATAPSAQPVDAGAVAIPPPPPVAPVATLLPVATIDAGAPIIDRGSAADSSAAIEPVRRPVKRPRATPAVAAPPPAAAIQPPPATPTDPSLPIAPPIAPPRPTRIGDGVADPFHRPGVKK